MALTSKAVMVGRSEGSEKPDGLDAVCAPHTDTKNSSTGINRRQRIGNLGVDM